MARQASVQKPALGVADATGIVGSGRDTVALWAESAPVAFIRLATLGRSSTSFGFERSVEECCRLTRSRARNSFRNTTSRCSCSNGFGPRTPVASVPPAAPRDAERNVDGGSARRGARHGRRILMVGAHRDCGQADVPTVLTIFPKPGGRETTTARRFAPTRACRGVVLTASAGCPECGALPRSRWAWCPPHAETNAAWSRRCRNRTWRPPTSRPHATTNVGSATLAMLVPSEESSIVVAGQASVQKPALGVADATGIIGRERYTAVLWVECAAQGAAGTTPA